MVLILNWISINYRPISIMELVQIIMKIIRNLAISIPTAIRLRYAASRWWGVGVSWFLGFLCLLVYWFLGSKFLSFKDYWFLGFEVSWLLGFKITEFQKQWSHITNSSFRVFWKMLIPYARFQETYSSPNAGAHRFQHLKNDGFPNVFCINDLLFLNYVKMRELSWGLQRLK